ATLDYRRDMDFIEHYRELLADTVRRHLRSQSPVSIEVSGGLDSSALFATAVELMRSGSVAAPGVRGYTLTFTGDEEADEIAYARAVAEHTGYSVEEITPAWLPLDWYAVQSAKFRDIIGYPNLIMAANELQAVSDSDSRVLIDGTGGDEWLGSQGFSFREAFSLLDWSEFQEILCSSMREEGVLPTCHRLARSIGGAILPESLAHRIRLLLAPGTRDSDGLDWLGPALREQLLLRRYGARPNVTEPCQLPGQQAGLAVLRNAFLAKNHIINERYAATFGVETRRPFYTKAMVQFSFVLPERLKYRSSLNKFTHRQAMQGLLPDLVLQRTTKAGFDVTFHRYLVDLEEELSQRIPRQHPGWLSEYQAERLYSLYRSGKHDGSPAWSLWSLLACHAIFSPS
ncbi:MAG: asparagine synthase C-terminal domain-containing protein, partial [Proteobacteria bacterium]|nr:asparagine synthase C-terminal domain-containing protein [Pseudomonadota bacterium]